MDVHSTVFHIEHKPFFELFFLPDGFSNQQDFKYMFYIKNYFDIYFKPLLKIDKILIFKC